MKKLFGDLESTRPSQVLKKEIILLILWWYLWIEHWALHNFIQAQMFGIKLKKGPIFRALLRKSLQLLAIKSINMDWFWKLNSSKTHWKLPTKVKESNLWSSERKEPNKRVKLLQNFIVTMAKEHAMTMLLVLAFTLGRIESGIKWST